MDINIFKYLDYIDFVADLARFHRIKAKVVAEDCRIHAAYFSRVMVRKAHFSSDQLFRIAQFFELSPEQTDYLFLLGEYNRAHSEEHRRYLKGRVTELRERKLKIEAELHDVAPASSREMQTYYMELVTGAIHMLLTIDKYRANPTLIKTRLGIDEAKLEFELQKLAELQLIEIKKREIRVLKDSIHLDEANEISAINHINFRLEAIKRINARRRALSDYHFSVSFSASEDTKMQIKQHFKEYLVKVQGMVMKDKSSDDLHFLTFDLF